MIDNLLNKHIKISKQLLNPSHQSTIYKFKPNDVANRHFTTNDKLTGIDFLWFMEQTIATGNLDQFTEEQNELLQHRVLYQCIRFNVIDSLYKYILNITKIKAKTRMYSFLLEDTLIEFKEHNIAYKGLANYKYVRDTLDTAYIMLNRKFRKFYTNYFMIEMNKIIRKEIKEKNIEYQAHHVVQQNSFIYCVFTQYKPYMPQFPLRDTSKQNFMHLFEDLITKKHSWTDFIKRCDDSYPEIIKKINNDNYPIKSNLAVQTTHYIEQIGIYLSFILELIKKHPEIPIANFCQNPVLYDLYYNYALNENQQKEIDNDDYFYAEIKTTSFSPIEVDINIENITLQDINRFVALLVQVEKYYYGLLESIFMIILYTNANSNEKQ